MDNPSSIAIAVRNRILAKAARSKSPGVVASVVLDSLIAEEEDLAQCDLDEIKRLLVEALRASRKQDHSPRGQMAG